MNIVADNAERGEAVCKMRFCDFEKRIQTYSNEQYIAVPFHHSKTKVFGHFVGVSTTWEKFIIRLNKYRSYLHKKETEEDDFFIFGNYDGKFFLI